MTKTMTNKASRTDEQTPRRLEDVRIPVRMKLSALWVSVMFLYVYVDILGFFKPGTIEDILVGRVWVLDISQAFVLGSLVLMAVPSLMIFLSLALPARQARWTNIVAASVYLPVSIGNVIDETWSYYFFGAAVETALLALVIRYAWTWPRRHDGVARQTSSEEATASTH